MDFELFPNAGNNGTCNIGDSGRRKRLFLGSLCLVNSFLLIYLIFISLVSPVWFLASFVLSLAGFLGILQYRYSFCVALGIQGKTNLEEKFENFEVISKYKSVYLVFQALIFAIALHLLVLVFL